MSADNNTSWLSTHNFTIAHHRETYRNSCECDILGCHSWKSSTLSYFCLVLSDIDRCNSGQERGGKCGADAKKRRRLCLPMLGRVQPRVHFRKRAKRKSARIMARAAGANTPQRLGWAPICNPLSKVLPCPPTKLLQPPRPKRRQPPMAARPSRKVWPHPALCSPSPCPAPNGGPFQRS